MPPCVDYDYDLVSIRHSPPSWPHLANTWRFRPEARAGFAELVRSFYNCLAVQDRAWFLAHSAALLADSRLPRAIETWNVRTYIGEKLKRDRPIFGTATYVLDIEKKMRKTKRVGRQACECNVVHTNIIELLFGCGQALVELGRLQRKTWQYRKQALPPELVAMKNIKRVTCVLVDVNYPQETFRDKAPRITRHEARRNCSVQVLENRDLLLRTHNQKTEFMVLLPAQPPAADELNFIINIADRTACA